MSQMNLKNLNKKVYMIRRKLDGKYSNGGSHPKFTTEGKAWTNIGHLKNHLNLLIDAEWERKSSESWRSGTPNNFNLMHSLDIYKDCDVIEFDVVASETNSIPHVALCDAIFSSYKEKNEWRFR